MIVSAGTNYSYGERYATDPIPKYSLASKVFISTIFELYEQHCSITLQGIGADAAYRVIHDELSLGTLNP